METARVAILTVGALLCVLGLVWLVLGGPKARLPRRAFCIGLLFLPIVVGAVHLATYPPPPSGRGGFLSAAIIILMMLSPWVLLWMFACFVAWAIGRIRAQAKA